MSDPGTTQSLQLMTRSGCALCDHVVLALEILRPRYQFTYAKVDIDSDPALQQRYGLRVPVLLAGDTKICAGHCEPEVIEAYLNTS